MTYDPKHDSDEPGDAHYPFQRGYVSRGSPTPYMIALLALAILAVIGLNIVSVDDANMLGQDKQITSEARPAAGSSASVN